MELSKFIVAIFFDGELEQHLVKAKNDVVAVKKAVCLSKRYHMDVVNWMMDAPDSYLELLKVVKDKGFVVTSRKLEANDVLVKEK
jgi:hypothetical protein